MWECSLCPLTSKRKWDTELHDKQKHKNQNSTFNFNEQPVPEPQTGKQLLGSVQA